LLVVLLIVCAGLPARADNFVLQGSTTFVDRLITQHHAAIEEQSQHKLTVIPNKTVAGLLALVQGQAHFAMISTDLEAGKRQLAKHDRDIPLDRLKSFEIARTRIAIGVHPDNPVTSVSLHSLRGILSGEIRNWQDVGGSDLPIRVVFVRDGGGVQASAEEQVLDGKPINAADQIRVQTSAQVARIVEQEPGALGLAQLNVIRRSTAKELTTDRIIEQRLSLITLDEPNAPMRNVIETIRRVAVLTSQ
jgi:phosphate transport system substrate-binding protein